MDAPDEAAWAPWSPEVLAQRLRPLQSNWYVAGGWAIDLFLGFQSRPHEDLEFAVSPVAAPQFAAHLTELSFFAAQSGRLTPWDAGSPVPDDIWQLWGAEKQTKLWRVDMMMERGTNTHWIYKRDSRVTLTRADAIRRNAVGIPYLSPAIVLLFKAKHHRIKDERDFQAVRPHLSGKDRRVLAGCLKLLHPNHTWLAQLAA